MNVSPTASRPLFLSAAESRTEYEAWNFGSWCHYWRIIILPSFHIHSVPIEPKESGVIIPRFHIHSASQWDKKSVSYVALYWCFFLFYRPYVRQACGRPWFPPRALDSLPVGWELVVLPKVFVDCYSPRVVLSSSRYKRICRQTCYFWHICQSNKSWEF